MERRSTVYTAGWASVGRGLIVFLRVCRLIGVKTTGERTGGWGNVRFFLILHPRRDRPRIRFARTLSDDGGNNDTGRMTRSRAVSATTGRRADGPRPETKRRVAAFDPCRRSFGRGLTDVYGVHAHAAVCPSVAGPATSSAFPARKFTGPVVRHSIPSGIPSS